jgi:hypothetical protein
MSEPRPGADHEWISFLPLYEEERVARMTARYSELAELDAAARHEQIVAQVKAVYSQPDADLRTLTESRLKSWLAMDPDKARIVGTDFETALNTMPADIAMRRVTIVQSVAYKLTIDQQAALRAIVPGVMGDEPVAYPSFEKADPMAVASATGKRPWWAFWRRA